MHGDTYFATDNVTTIKITISEDVSCFLDGLDVT